MKLATRHNLQLVCPFCRDFVAREEDLRTCAGCRALYHTECLVGELEGTCAVLGCGTSTTARLRGRITPERARAACVACDRGFVTETPIVCSTCGAEHHRDCVPSGRCRVIGCRGDVQVPTWRAPQPVRPPEVTSSGGGFVIDEELLGTLIGVPLFLGYYWMEFKGIEMGPVGWTIFGFLAILCLWLLRDR